MTIDNILFQIVLGKPKLPDNSSMFKMVKEEAIFVIAKDYAMAVNKSKVYIEQHFKTRSIVDELGGIDKEVQEWGDFIREVKIISNEVII